MVLLSLGRNFRVFFQRFDHLSWPLAHVHERERERERKSELFEVPRYDQLSRLTDRTCGPLKKCQHLLKGEGESCYEWLNDSRSTPKQSETSSAGPLGRVFF